MPAASAAASSLARLADAGEDDALRRHAGGQRAAQFAFRDDVGAGAQLGQQAQHGEVRVRLDREADQRPGCGREGVGEGLIAGCAATPAE